MKQIILALLFIFSISVSAQQGAKYYVKTDATGNGTSWASAGNFHSMLLKAKKGSTIYVAAGEYRGGFTMVDGVNVLGGFPANASNSTTLEDRRLPGTEKNLTILDGGSIMRPLMQHTDFSTETIWEGFIIQNGNANGVGTIVYQPDGITPAGIVFDYDIVTKKAKAVALTENEKVIWGPWSTEGHQHYYTGAYDLNEGYKNWEPIKAFVEDGRNWDKYPAWNYARQQREANLAGYNDWYLPAKNEIQEVYAQKDMLNLSLMRIPGALKLMTSDPNTSFYWSGTEAQSGANAFCVNFNTGSHSIYLSGIERRARLMRTFSNVIVEENGGAVYLLKNGVIMNCIIKNSVTSKKGGGIYLGENAKAIGCLIHDCIANEASGIYMSPNSTVTNNTIVNNNINRTPILEETNLPDIGDFYYADNTWGSSPTNAIGIICYINPKSPKNGYILYPEERRNLGSSIEFEDSKIWANSVGSDWETPSLIVMNDIFENVTLLNSKLGQIYKASLLPVSTLKYYWTNSFENSENAWVVEFLYGAAEPKSKDYKARARAVKAF